MSDLSQEEVLDVLAMVSLALEDQVLLAPECSTIFSIFFIKTNSFNFFDNYTQIHPILSESAQFRTILKSKNLFNLYYSSPANFVKECAHHMGDIKNTLNQQLAKNNETSFAYDHPVHLVGFDLPNILSNCKKQYLNNNDLTGSLVEKNISAAYKLTIALFFSSNIGTPKIARAIRDSFQGLGLNSEKMKILLEESEVNYNLVSQSKNNILSQIEKKNILLMAIQLSYIDQRTLTPEEASILNKYKNKFFESSAEVELYKHFLYLSDPAYFKHYKSFSKKAKIENLAFLLNCLSLDFNITKNEKLKYLEIITRFGVTLTPETSLQISEISKIYKSEPDMFNKALMEQSYPERVYTIINCAELLYIDRHVTTEEEECISKTLDTIFIEDLTCHELSLSFMIFLNFIMKSYDGNASNPIFNKMERFFLKKLDHSVDLYKMINLILLHSESSESMSVEKLGRLKNLVSNREEDKVHLVLVREFENVFPKEFHEIQSNTKKSVSLEIFLRLVLQPHKCLELESFKDSIVNFTLAHIELTVSHNEFNHQLIKLIDNVTFELKIKSSTLDIKKMAIEIACELAISDNNIDSSEHKLIDKYTKSLLINENESFKLTSRILLYSQLPIFIHDYLNYAEYKVK